MKTTVILVVFNGEAWLPRCLGSILAQNPIPDLVALDNGSCDQSPTILRSFVDNSARSGLRGQLVELEENIGFTRGVNLAITASTEEPPDFYFLLNQDAWLEDGCIASLEAAMQEHPRAAILGTRILYPDARHIQHAGGFLQEPRMTGLHYGHHEIENETHYDEVREVDFVTGAAMMIRRAALGDDRLFNDVFSPGYYEDVELCSRLSIQGWKTLYIPEARAFHEESSSFAKRASRLRLSHRNRLVFLADRLADRIFRTAFLEAEIDFLKTGASFDEILAIKGATLDILLGLPKILNQRLGEISVEHTAKIRQTLRRLHEESLKVLSANFPLDPASREAR